MLWEKFHQDIIAKNTADADPILISYAMRSPFSGKVLDLGIGTAINSYPLALAGFEVIGVDTSKVAEQHCKKLALGIEKEKTGNITFHLMDVMDFMFPDKYSIIIMSMLSHCLKWEQLKLLTSRMKKSLDDSGFIFVSCFSPKDPNTNSKLERKAQTYAVEDIQSLLISDKLKTVYKSEVEELDLAHGEPHYHIYHNFIVQNS